MKLPTLLFTIAFILGCKESGAEEEECGGFVHLL